MVERFTRTERTLHWVHATGFFAMLATGLVLYLPALSEFVARRNLVKNVHIFVAVAWAIAIVLVFALGDRRRLAADWREIETLDRDDRRWLRGRPAAQGRFNAGQKLNAIVTAAFALLFAISGFFLWLGFAVTIMATNNAFGMRRFSLTLIDGGHWLGVLLIQGAIIGLVGVRT